VGALNTPENKTVKQFTDRAHFLKAKWGIYAAR